MATTIQIKRTTTNALPATLEQGELVYVEGAGGDGQKLYVGAPSGTNVPLTVGGVYYVNMLDHTAGVNTADSAVIVDADKKIDEWNVDNLTMDGNTISSTDANGNILLSPNGTGQTVVYNPYVDATTAGEATDMALEDYVKKFGGKTVVTQDGLNNTVDTGVDPPTVTIGITDGGIANIKLANDGITIGSTDMSLGTTHTDLIGLTSAVVDNISIDGNNVVATTGNLVLDGTMITTATGKTTKLQGDVDFGDGTSNNTVTFNTNCRVDSAIIPSVTGSFDLGTPTLKWRTLYADGSAFADVTNGVDANNAIGTTTGSGLDLVVSSDSGTVSLSGTMNVTNNLNVTGAAQMQTTLQVTGDTTMAANAVVIGDTTMQGDLTLGTVATPVSFNSFSSQSHVGSFAIDQITMDGSSIFTNATNTSLTLAPNGTGDVQSQAHLVPTIDATYDLGSATRKWRNIYADTVSFGNVRIAGADDQTVDTVAGDLVLDSSTGETVVNDNVTVNGTLDVTGATAIGTNAASTTLDIYAVTTHTGQITQTGNLVQTGIHTINGSAEIDNVSIDGNTISTALATNGDLSLTPDGTGRTIITSLHIANGINATPEFIGNYVPAQWDTVTTVNDGLNKSYDSVSNTITIGITDASIANVKLVNNSITVGTDVVALGDTITDLNGITSLDVDTMTLDGNVISTTLTDQDLALDPNGQGTVTVPVGYSSRTGFVDDSLVTKGYVDGLVEGLDIIESARVATIADIPNLAAHGTIDGLTLVSGDRVLVKDQNTPSENGVYVSDGTGLTRSDDANTGAEIDGGTFCFVEQGTYANNGFVTTHEGAPVLGTDPITWTQFSGAGQITAGSAMSKTGNTLDVEVDGATIEVTADALNVKDLGIQNQHIADTTIDLTAKVTNVLPVPNGGTGLATVTQYGMLVGDGTSPLAILAPNTTAGYLVQNTAGTGQPVWSNVIDGGSY